MYRRYRWQQYVLLYIAMLALLGAAEEVRQRQLLRLLDKTDNAQNTGANCCKVVGHIESYTSIHGVHGRPMILDFTTVGLKDSGVGGLLCYRQGYCNEPKWVKLYERGVQVATVTIGDGKEFTGSAQDPEIGGSCQNPASNETALFPIPLAVDKCSENTLWLAYARWMLGERRTKLKPMAQKNLVHFPPPVSAAGFHRLMPSHHSEEPWRELFRDWKRLDDMEKFINQVPYLKEAEV